MNFGIGDKVLITTNAWFFAPDGRNYRAVFGTVKAIHTDEHALGIKTNRNSTNWYVEIGSVLIAGCQVHYAVRCDTCNFAEVIDQGQHEGRWVASERDSHIFNADGVA